MNQRAPATSSSGILRSSAWTLLSNIVPIVAGLVSIPLIISLLGTDRFGVLVIIWMFIGYLNLFDLGLSRGTTRFVTEYLERDDHDGILRVVWTTQVAMIGIGMVVALALFAGAGFIAEEHLGAGPELQIEAGSSLRWLALSIPFVIVSNGLRGVLQSYNDFKYLSLLATPFSIAMYLVPVLVALVTPNLVAVALALIVVRILNFFLLLKRTFGFTGNLFDNVAFSGPEFKRIITYGGWISVSNIVSPLMRTLDRFFIASILGATAVAWYATPFEMVTKLWIVPGAIVTVLFPMFSRQIEENVLESIRILKNASSFIFIIVFPVCLGGVTLAPEVISLWIDAEFSANSFRVMQVLTIGVFINCVAYIYFAFVQGAGHPGKTAVLHMIELPLYCAALYLLTEPLGLIGVAWIWVIRVSLDAIVVFMIGAAIEQRIRDYSRQLILASIAALTALAIPMLLEALSLRLIYAVVLMVIATLATLRVYPAQQLRAMLRQRKA